MSDLQAIFVGVGLAIIYLAIRLTYVRWKRRADIKKLCKTAMNKLSKTAQDRSE